MTEKIFGSNVDWLSQHSVFPEYFRQQFYETGTVFPEFAANIGGGQNIYNFAYYGLYNPIFLPAYFLPFVKMSDYIIFISLFCLAADVLLFYKWLRNHGVSKGNSILTAMLFLLAGPMIFHSYTHIMFVNYMPFLILSLMGTDRYFQKKKSDLLTGSVFLMIMTSFYFSIGGILVLFIYGVFQYLDIQEKQRKKVTAKSFAFACILFCIPILTAVMMSGFLLMPTAMALLKGEHRAAPSVSLEELFLPDSDYMQILYSPYGIGLTTLALTVLITGFTYKKWKEKYLHIACFLVILLPAFQYVLNGGLYIRGKVLIPMLPLLCYLIAMYLEKQRKQEIPFWQGILPFMVTLIMIWGGKTPEKITQADVFLLIDAGLMLFCGLLFYSQYFGKKHKEKIVIIVPIGLLLLYGIVMQKESSQMVEKDFYLQLTDKDYSHITEEILEKEEGFYRMEQAGTRKTDAANLNRIWSAEQYSSSVYSSTYSEVYQSFRKDIFQVEQPYRNIFMQARAQNPVFQKLMGVKYILSEEDIPGYQEIEENVYENPEVYPIAYATNQYLSEQDYSNLEFPYNQTAFLDFAIVKDGSSCAGWKEKLQAKIQETDLGFKQKEIDIKQAVSKSLPIPQAKEGDILLLQFDVENHNVSQDISVDVEGIRNKLTEKEHIYYNENETFTYAVMLEEGQTQIQINFGKGTYEIKNLKSYIWRKDKEDSKNQTLCQSDFVLDKQATKGNKIAGTIERKEAGTLITSIPFDENFTVSIDGKKAKTEKVNTAFLGIKMEKGIHDIEIIYHSPGLKTGEIISAVGLLFWVFGRKLKVGIFLSSGWKSVKIRCRKGV